MDGIPTWARVLWREKRADILTVGALAGLLACLVSVALAPAAPAVLGRAAFWLVLGALWVWANIEFIAARRHIAYGVVFSIKAVLWLAVIGLAIGGMVDIARRPASTVLLTAILIALVSGRRSENTAPITQNPP